MSKRGTVKQIYELWKASLPDAGRTFKKEAGKIEINPQALVLELYTGWYQMSKQQKYSLVLAIGYKIEAEN